MKTLIQHVPKSESYEDLCCMEVVWKKSISGLHDSGQFTAGALLTSIGVSSLTPKLYDKWLVSTQDEDEVPDVKIFMKFLHLCISTTAPSTS